MCVDNLHNMHDTRRLLELLGSERELGLESVGGLAVVVDKLVEGLVLMVALVFVCVVLAILVEDL